MVDQRKGGRPDGAGETGRFEPEAPSTRREGSCATFILVDGPSPGVAFELASQEATIGSGPQADFLIPDEGVSPLHARIVRRDGGVHVEDLNSATGTRVREKPVSGATELADGDHVRLGENVLLMFDSFHTREQAATAKLYEATVKDSLTRAYNRRHFEGRHASEFAYAKRHGTPLSVLLLAVDQLDRLSEEHGRDKGEAVLRALASELWRLLRAEDVLARYEGDVFAVLARGIPVDHARILGSRMLVVASKLGTSGDLPRLRSTVSVGVATMLSDRPFETTSAQIDSAARALREAQNGGGNRVAGE